MAESEIEGLGAESLVPRTSNADVAQLGLSAEEGFVLSRVDGRTPLGVICMLVPFPREQTVKILTRLWRDGAIDLPGKVRPVKPPAIVAAERPRVPTPAPRAERADPTPLYPTGPRFIEAKTDPGVPITEEQKRRIDEFFATLDTRDAFELLEVGRAADAKEIKRAYFRLSKEFHPDRYYKKEVGVYKERMIKVFQAIKAAFELLTDDKRRQDYLESLDR
jgi:hypothetical protein